MLLKEISELYRFFWKTPKNSRIIVFYSEHKEYFPYYEGLINKLVNSYDQQICYVTSDDKDHLLKNSSSSINVFYINKFLILFMQIVNCKIFIMTLTDLNRYHLNNLRNPNMIFLFL